MSRESDATVDQLARAHALVTGVDPLPQDFLVAVTRDRLFAQGAAIPAVSMEYTVTAGGLLVPSSFARPAQPLDQVKVYLIAEDVVGRSISKDEVIDALAGVSLELAVPWIATWLARLHAPGARQTTVDAQYIECEVGERFGSKVRNLLRDPNTVLLTPQSLTCLLKLALLVCPSQGPPEPQERHEGKLPFALMGLMEHLASGLNELEDVEDTVISGVPGPLGRETIANQLGNSHRQEAGRWAAFVRCWRELPQELAGHPRVINLEQAYEAATGVPLDDLVTVCAAMWATAANGTPHMGPDYFDGLAWTPRRLHAALDLVTAAPDDLARDVYDDMETHGFAWSRRAFEHHPVIRWPSGHLTVVDPHLLIDRAAGVWPLLDIRRELGRRGRHSEVRRANAAYEHVMETYAIEIARSLTEGGRSGRVYDDCALKKAFGSTSQVADIAIDYGHAWVVIEATTRGVQSRTIAGVSDQAATQDIARFVEKSKQIDATIANLRRSEDKLVGRGAAPPGGRRFHPVLLVASPVSVDPIFMSLLREALTAAGVLQGADVAALEVMELEDLDIVETLVEEGGPSLLDVLAGKEYSPLRGAAVRDYILLGLGRRGLLRPARVSARWRGWLDTAIREWTRSA
ncbi:hypothetical protein F9L07_27265 [Pimelobacter simplex]|uniref:Uncharacterized protein n=1 Tax=Nocardioides simplex TaxID=2045 RepID=A0A7J5DR17_NOCSI|nr:hypothetical protein [Pimelobacter simplex]KAB2807192.1 hypothetical protein F9L07_27265 [Pimelobacter simplex]